MARTNQPAVHRTIVLVDVEGFGAPSRTLPHQLATRDVLYRVVAQALEAAGVRWEDCHHEDRGDSVFILVPPEYPKAPLVEVVPAALARAVRAHNDSSHHAQHTRLRLAVHAGEVAFDDHGVTSTSLTTAFRLLDAAPLKRSLADSPGLVAMIVSRLVFDEVVRHSAVLDPATFRPVAVAVKEIRDVAWIALPDHPYPADPAVLDSAVLGSAVHALDHNDVHHVIAHATVPFDTSATVPARGAVRAGSSPGYGQVEPFAGGPRKAAPGPGGTRRRRFGAVPPRAGAFQRRAVAEVLVDTAAGGGTTVLTGTGAASVLTGLGGVGKTQLATDHAHTQWDHGQVQLLVWVSARSRDAVTSAYADVAMELLGQDPANPKRAWRRLLEWLAETTAPWLVVLDDLQDPDHLTGLWPPHTSTGQVVVTTRRRDAALHSHQRHIVDIGLFTSEEALSYLTEKLPDRARTDPAELAALAGDLGHLPLALAQAAAYLTNKSLLTTAGYRNRLADRRTRLPDVLPRQPHLPDEHERTVAATWSLSIEAADELDPTGLARPALELASLLDPAGIPAAVFTTDAVTAHLTARLGRDVTGEDVLGGLECLRLFSLITLHPDQPHHAVRVHALVQHAVRDTLAPDTLAALTRTVADALALVWPGIETDQELIQALRSNTTTLQDTAEEHLWLHGGHPALFQLARSLGDAGLLDSAITVNRRLLRQASARLGPDHPDTLTTRFNLARLRGEAGDSAAAVTLFADLLADQLRVLGPDHPHTLATRANLARWRGEAGDPAAAATALAELLPDRLRVLGPDHPYTLATRHILAYWLGEAGNPAAAATALAELLPDQLRVLGPDHPHTLATRANLARWRGEAGDPAAAATGFAELLPDRLRILGPDHPYTLITRHGLAYWLGEAGDPATAVTALAALLPDQLRVLGPDHPHTLHTRTNLARLRGEAGDPATAVAALAELLPDQVRVLGPDHPHTLRSRSYLAHAYESAGDLGRAIPLYEATLADRERVLGADHPDTLRSRNNLACAYRAAGDAERAILLHETALADAERVLGPDHPLAEAIRSHIAPLDDQN